MIVSRCLSLFHYYFHKQPLDPRGYCTNVYAYSPTSHFKPTWPPKRYPSASPYAQLTAFLKELIEEKVISRYLIRALLYPEITRDVDTTEVILRKRHKTFVRMIRKESNHSESEGSSCLGDGENSPEPDQHVYSNVKYVTGKRESQQKWPDTVYESFIDHGTGAGEVFYERLNSGGVMSSIDSICFVTECPECQSEMEEELSSKEDRTSFMLGSTPTKYIERKSPTQNNVVHMTTARMNLLTIKQQSEQSEVSSFEHRLSNAYMGFENLANLDGSMKMKKLPLQPLPRAPVIESHKHHSMPSLLVGNRFNHSSVTEIFIPTHRDKHDLKSSILQKAVTPNNSFDDSNHSHSSTLTLPAPGEFLMPLPDNIQAEIIYNMTDDDHLSELSEARRYSCNEDLIELKSEGESDFGWEKETDVEYGWMKKEDRPYNTKNPFNHPSRRKDSFNQLNPWKGAWSIEDDETTLNQQNPSSFFDSNTNNQESPFHNEPLNEPRYSLARDASPFSRHSINSDKKICNDKGNYAASANKRSTDASIGQAHDLKLRMDAKCPCHSRLSNDSDSGILAGSYTLSPDHPPHKCEDYSRSVASSSFISRSNYVHASEKSDSNAISELNCDSAMGAESSHVVFKVTPARVKADQRNQVTYCTGLYAHWWKKETLPSEMVAQFVPDGGSGKMCLAF